MRRLFAFLCFVPLVPVIFAAVAALLLYRLVISWILKLKHGDDFVGLLVGADAMWGLEEQNNCGVINAVAFVECVDLKALNDVPRKVRQVFCERFEEVLRTKKHQFEKMLWRRNKAFGYFYWTNDVGLTVSDYITLLEIKSGETYLEEKEIRDLAGQITSRRLPADHTAAWEFLIGSKPVYDSKRNIYKFPIFLRFHHSLADGISMLRFFLEELQNQPDSLLISKQKPKPISVGLKKRVSIWIKVLYELPIFLISVLLLKLNNKFQAILATKGSVVSWQHEADCSYWFQLMNETRSKIPGVSFSSAFLAALSGTLSKFFTAKGWHHKSITIASTVRMKHEDFELKLDNAFATPMQQLPILPSVQLEHPTRRDQLIAKLHLMKQTIVAMRSLTNSKLTHMMMTDMATVLPIPILEFLSKQFPITLAVSLMPEVKDTLKIGPVELKNLIFWPPVFGTVGVNLVGFPYDGRLHLCLLANRSVFADVPEGSAFLEELLQEIRRMSLVLSEE